MLDVVSWIIIFNGFNAYFGHPIDHLEYSACPAKQWVEHTPHTRQAEQSDQDDGLLAGQHLLSTFPMFRWASDKYWNRDMNVPDDIKLDVLSQKAWRGYRTNDDGFAKALI